MYDIIKNVQPFVECWLEIAFVVSRYVASCFLAQYVSCRMVMPYEMWVRSCIICRSDAS